MQMTPKYGLKKPEGTDPVDIQDFNDNTDLIEEELEKRPEKNGDASNMTASFTEAVSLSNITSGDSLKVIFGKVKRAVTRVLSLDKQIGVYTMLKLSQAEYDALATKDSNTIYYIVG